MSKFLHEVLRAARLEQNLSLRQLTDRCGVLFPVISRIEQNKSKDPHFWVVARIAKALDLSLDDLAKCEMPTVSKAARQRKAAVSRQNWRDNRDSIVEQMKANRAKQLKRTTRAERSQQARKSWITRRENEASAS